jgi:hypothetical protein
VTATCFSFKAIRLDDSISGADLDRPGFQALNRGAIRDKSVSDVFIHMRDWFGRPEDAIDMVAREKKLLLAGITSATTSYLRLLPLFFPSGFLFRHGSSRGAGGGNCSVARKAPPSKRDAGERWQRAGCSPFDFLWATLHSRDVKRRSEPASVH